MTNEVKKLVELLKELNDELCLPDSSCSCHISPPCSDCVDHGYQRELKERVKIELEAFEAQEPKPVAREWSLWRRRAVDSWMVVRGDYDVANLGPAEVVRVREVLGGES